MKIAIRGKGVYPISIDAQRSFLNAMAEFVHPIRGARLFVEAVKKWSIARANIDPSVCNSRCG
jgi:hypothetical protein